MLSRISVLFFVLSCNFYGSPHKEYVGRGEVAPSANSASCQIFFQIQMEVI